MSDELDKYLRNRRAERRGDRASERAPIDPVGCFPMSAIDALEAKIADELAQPPVVDLVANLDRAIWRRDAWRSAGHVLLGVYRRGKLRHVDAEKFQPVGFGPVDERGELIQAGRPSDDLRAIPVESDNFQ